MPMTPQAAKMYKPRRPDVTLEDVVTPEERARRAEAVQAEKDKAEQPKLDKAYEASKTGAYANGGYVRSADGCAVRGKTRGKMV